MRPSTRPDPFDLLADRLDKSLDRRDMEVVRENIKLLRSKLGGEKTYIKQSDLANSARNKKA